MLRGRCRIGFTAITQIGTEIVVLIFLGNFLVLLTLSDCRIPLLTQWML